MRRQDSDRISKAPLGVSRVDDRTIDTATTTQAGAAEADAKRARNYGQPGAALGPDSPSPDAHEHFGVVIASCEGADLRPTPEGVMVYGDAERRLEPVPLPPIPRQAVMDELHGAVVHGQAPLHSGAWGLATLEVCLGILESARTGREVAMTLQVPT
jgi:phthalate 4,5-cis-dihydrodiol dehydrogenase